MKRLYCRTGDHYPEVTLVEGVQCDNNGTVSNTWYDGTRGVPDYIRELAEDEESLVCYDSDCPGYLEECEWQEIPK